MFRYAALLSLFLVSCFVASKTEAAVCTYNANGEVIVNSVPQDANGIDYFCDFTADQLNLKIFGLYLCKANPQPETYRADCEEVFFDPAGRQANIEYNATNGLGLTDLSIPLGEYSYAAFLSDKALGATFTARFDRDIQGSSGAGPVCWSNGNTSKISYSDPSISSFAVDCGSEAQAAPQTSYFNYSFFFQVVGGNGVYLNKLEGIPSGGPRSAFILKNLNELADITPGANSLDTNAVTSNAMYLLGVQKLTTPQKITADTKGVDIGFAIKDTFMHKLTANSRYKSGVVEACGGTRAPFGGGPVASLTPHPTSGAVACFVGSRPKTFQFRFEVN